ncbi:hypothetical protein V4V35_25525, partial [Bacillus infantis]
MFLNSKISKGRYYVYLCRYFTGEYSSSQKEIVFNFGRSDLAAAKLYKWRDDFKDFPIELRELG